MCWLTSTFHFTQRQRQENLEGGELDLVETFDTVDHYLLIKRLRSTGFDRDAYSWFQSYLCDRRQCVKMGGAQSGFLPVTIGVPHGSIQGPVLFIIYINETFVFPAWLPNSSYCKRYYFVLYC